MVLIVKAAQRSPILSLATLCHVLFLVFYPIGLIGLLSHVERLMEFKGVVSTCRLAIVTSSLLLHKVAAFARSPKINSTAKGLLARTHANSLLGVNGVTQPQLAASLTALVIDTF